MITPNSEDVTIFKDYTVADFQRWLRIGLEGYLLEGNVWDFEPMALFINQDEHLVLDLYNIYQVLPSRLQAYFRKAVADIIATLDADIKKAVVFEHLLLLASQLSATEVLSVLPSRIGNGFFGTVKIPEGESLFGITIRTIAELAAPVEDATKCLQALIGSHYFKDAYAGMALVALCQVAPQDLPDHLEKLGIKLQNMFRQYKMGTVEKRRLAERIYNKVGFYYLKEALRKLKIIDPEYEVSTSHKWFADALFKKIELEEPLIEYVIQSDGGIEIYDPINPSNRDIINPQPCSFFDIKKRGGLVPRSETVLKSPLGQKGYEELLDRLFPQASYSAV